MQLLVIVHRRAIVVVEIEAGVVHLVDVDADGGEDLRFDDGLRVVDDAGVLHHVEGVDFFDPLLFEHLLCDWSDDCLFDPLDGVPFLDEVLFLTILYFGDDVQIVLLVEFYADGHVFDVDGFRLANYSMFSVDLCWRDLILLFYKGKDNLVY